MRSHNPANYRSCCEDETQRRNRTNLCKVATSPAIEFTQMNNAETAAAWRMCAHSQNSNSGVRNIPPSVPVRPERKPRPAPALIATGREGATVCGGSLDETPSALRKRVAQRLSEPGEPKQRVVGNRRRMQPEWKVARMAKIISTRNNQPARIGMCQWMRPKC